MAERIQLRRTKGWRKPAGAIVVARPTKWGNPFKVGERIDLDDPGWCYVADKIPGGTQMLGQPMRHVTLLDPEIVIAAYFDYLVNTPHLWLAIVEELAGHDLCCWCPLDQPCHADVLLELANS